MTSVKVEVWDGPRRVLGHTCKNCGGNFRIRYKRKYRDLCGPCAISFAQTNAMRIKRGQKPLNLGEYRIQKYVKKIYAVLGGHKDK